MTMSLSTGLISGMDTGSLITQLIAAEAGPQTALKARLKATETTASAYRTVNTTFLAVSAAAQAALSPGAWTPVKASSTSSSVAVSATAGATANSLSFTVKQLASGHAVLNRSATPGGWTSATSLYGASQITVSDENGTPSATTITIGGTGTLADAAAAINASDHGLTASVVQISTGEARLRITSKETGLASKFSLSGAGIFDPSTDAADAKITIGGPDYPVDISSTTNTFASVLAGATFTVSKAGEAATVSITSDPDAVAAKVQSLVDAVNAAVKYARDYTSNAPGSTATLKGDYAVSSLGARLMDAVSFPIPGAVLVNPPGVTLPLPRDGFPSAMGFAVAKDGKSIDFDKTKFLTALKADPALAQRMVGGTAAGAGADEKVGTADDVAASGIAGRLLAVAKGATDTTTGSLVSLANGQDSLMKGYKDQIAAWDLRLAKRKEMLTRQFTAMETSLSSLRNQSTWLAGQINSLPSG
ncbi:MAG: flagellar filament capping protein FliD [Blastococcus sp.]